MIAPRARRSAGPARARAARRNGRRSAFRAEISALCRLRVWPGRDRCQERWARYAYTEDACDVRVVTRGGTDRYAFDCTSGARRTTRDARQTSCDQIRRPLSPASAAVAGTATVIARSVATWRSRRTAPCAAIAELRSRNRLRKRLRGPYLGTDDPRMTAALYPAASVRIAALRSNSLSSTRIARPRGVSSFGSRDSSTAASRCAMCSSGSCSTGSASL